MSLFEITLGLEYFFPDNFRCNLKFGRDGGIINAQESSVLLEIGSVLEVLIYLDLVEKQMSKSYCLSGPSVQKEVVV